jgi:hypothetical protein
MRKVVEYATLLATQHSSMRGNLKEMDDMVEEAILLGWQPLGGACIGKDNKVVQTMVKYDNEIL